MYVFVLFQIPIRAVAGNAELRAEVWGSLPALTDFIIDHTLMMHNAYFHHAAEYLLVRLLGKDVSNL